METMEWIDSNGILLSYHGDGSGYSGRGVEKAYGYGSGIGCGCGYVSGSGHGDCSGFGYGDGSGHGSGAEYGSVYCYGIGKGCVKTL